MTGVIKNKTVDRTVNSPRWYPRRGSCAIEILSFQNFYKVLKTCSAGRKDFFDTLKRRAKYAAFFAMDILR